MGKFEAAQAAEAAQYYAPEPNLFKSFQGLVLYVISNSHFGPSSGSLSRPNKGFTGKKALFGHRLGREKNFLAEPAEK